MHGAIGEKYYIATMAQRKEVDILKDFGNRKIKVLNEMYDLQVVLLKYSEEKKAYYNRIVIGG